MAQSSYDRIGGEKLVSQAKNKTLQQYSDEMRVDVGGQEVNLAAIRKKYIYMAQLENFLQEFSHSPHKKIIEHCIIKSLSSPKNTELYRSIAKNLQAEANSLLPSKQEQTEEPPINKAVPSFIVLGVVALILAFTLPSFLLVPMLINFAVFEIIATSIFVFDKLEKSKENEAVNKQKDAVTEELVTLQGKAKKSGLLEEDSILKTFMEQEVGGSKHRDALQSRNSVSSSITPGF
jgi:hypothetical protein